MTGSSLFYPSTTKKTESADRQKNRQTSRQNFNHWHSQKSTVLYTKRQKIRQTEIQIHVKKKIYLDRDADILTDKHAYRDKDENTDSQIYKCRQTQVHKCIWTYSFGKSKWYNETKTTKH